jgi:hypothetical protein
MSPRRKALREAGCLAAYATLTGVATYPLVARIGRAIPAAANGDSWVYLWNLWWVKRALINLHVSPYFTRDLHFPYGASLYFHTLNLLPDILALPIATMAGPAAAYNVIALTAFVLSGYGMYRLALYVLVRLDPAEEKAGAAIPLAAFTAGVVFAFSSYRFVHLLGHLDLLSTEWLPFYVLFLLKTRNERGWINPVVCALFLTATLLTDAYYFLFLLIFTAFLVAHTFWRRTPALGAAALAPIVRIGAALATFAIIASPVLIPMLVLGRSAGRTANPAYDVDRFSADLLAFVVPSPLHPLWGDLVAPVYQNISRNNSGVEGVVFLGVVPILLALAGIRRYPAMRTSWLIAAGAFAAMAAGPTLHIAGRAVSIVPSFLMPYGLLARLPYGDIPRVPARFAVMTTLCLSILAAAGALAVFKRHDSRRAITATFVLAVLIPAEHAILPLPVADASAPAFYERLRDEPARGGVLEVPIPDDPAAFPQRMLYQTVHEKPVYGGYLARGLPPLAFEAVPGFSQFKANGPGMPGITDLAGTNDIVVYDPMSMPALSRTAMNAYHVAYVVIDKRLMDSAGVERKRRVAETLLDARSYEDADVLAFTLTPDAPGTAATATGAWLDTGWSYLESTPGQDAHGQPIRWRWMGDEARLALAATKPSKVRLRLAAQAFGKDRGLGLSLGPTAIATLPVRWRDEADYDTPAFDLPAGVSFLDLRSIDAAQSPGRDRRRLSVAFFRIELIVVD